MSHLEKFLEVLNAELPDICADKDLVEHLPNIFKSLSTVHRMRYRGQVPPHFSIEPNIYYLREDVVDWLRSQYKVDEVDLSQVKKRNNDHGGARR